MASEAGHNGTGTVIVRLKACWGGRPFSKTCARLLTPLKICAAKGMGCISGALGKSLHQRDHAAVPLGGLLIPRQVELCFGVTVPPLGGLSLVAAPFTMSGPLYTLGISAASGQLVSVLGGNDPSVSPTGTALHRPNCSAFLRVFSLRRDGRACSTPCPLRRANAVALRVTGGDSPLLCDRDFDLGRLVLSQTCFRG